MKKLYILYIFLLVFITSCKSQDLSEYESELKFPQAEQNLIEDVDESEKTIMVHITGEVLRSGVYEMHKGDRIIDVVEEAGGFTINANKEYVNLSEKIKDGMKIHIPSISERVSIKNNSGSSNEIIDINLATKEELMKLPSVGEKMSDAIIKYREESEFTDFDDLLNVPGIGQKTLESFKGLISIGGEIYE